MSLKLAEQGSKAIFALNNNTLKSIFLNIETMSLFDCYMYMYVGSILNYGSAVWGHHKHDKGDNIDKVH